MPKQKSTWDSTHTTSQNIDNPTSLGQNEGQPPFPAQLVIRETAQVQHSGFMMLVPRLAPRYLLIPDAPRKQLRAFDLLRPSGPGVAVLHGDDVFSFNAALSADGGSICLACVGSMRVYDTAPLLEAAKTLLERSEAEAEDQVGPRACAPNIEGHSTPADVVFSQDSDRLFVLWRNESGITVHDPCQPNLPMLRRLSFHGPSHYLSNSMLACANGLLAAAAGGGDGSPLPSSEQEARLRRQVKLWRVDADGETELRTLSTPDLADSIAISPGGDLIAIGLRNGGVRWIPFRQFLSPMATDDGAEGEQYVHVEPEAAGESTSVPMAHTLCFSHDGSKLVVGRADLDDFTIYEVASAAVVGRFVHKKSAGASATFFPADDVLVTGTVASGQPCVFHRLLPPIPRFELALSDTSVAISSSDVAPGGELGPIIAMAAGSQLYVYTTTRKVLLHHDFGKELFTSLNRIRTAVRMDPNGKFVACVLMKATVVVMSVADGSELLRMDPNGCHGMWWSPDGALLAVACLTGTRVFSTDMGFAEIQHLSDDGFSVSACVFDKTGTRLATAGNAGRVTIWEVATWRPTRKLEVGSLIYDVCFSSNGDRLAYQALEDLHVGVFSLEAESDAEQQVVFSKVNAVSDLKFSPDGNFLLCCPSAERSFDLHRMRVLDLTTQTDAEWGELLRAMALPVAGTLCGRTLGWAELTQSEGDITGDSSNLHWTLYGAVGNRMVATDIDASVQAIQDNAWTPEQLAFCSQHLQEDLGSIVEDAPHCSNIRDKDTGETVLHQLARARQTKSLQKWLSACPHATPVADNQGLTAVQVAVQLEQIDSAQAMWEARVALPSFITSISASLVLQELQLLPKTHPHLVRSFLLDVEPAIVRTLSTFRTELAREVEVCGLPTATHHGGSTDDNGVFQSVASERPLIWSDKCSADSLKQVVAWRVVVLPNLLGDAKSSPFHDITARCGAPVFDSKLLELVVQSKWEENVSTRRMWSIVAYGCAGVIEAVAMVVSAKSENAGTNTFSAAGMLQGLVMVIELSSLGFDAFQMAREGLKAYLTGPWNVLGVVTSTLLLIGSAFHFMRVGDGVRTVGALGVALKCFGLVNYLRSFPATGSLIRMISVILVDMIPFMTILSSVMLGCAMFFVIHMPSSQDSGSGTVHELFQMLVNVLHMSLGIGQGIDTSTASVTTVAVVTVFTSFVVVVLLNLLIAIMGDSYEKVKESERVEAIRERACIIVEMEKRFPKSHRYHRFMHYVEAVDSAGKSQEVVWEGVTRRVTEVMKTETSRLDGELNTKLAEMKTETSRLDGELNVKLAEMKSELNTKIELLDSKLDTLLASLK